MNWMNKSCLRPEESLMALRHKRRWDLKLSPLSVALYQRDAQQVHRLVQETESKEGKLSKTEVAWLKNYLFEMDDAELLQTLLQIKHLYLYTTKTTLFIRALATHSENLINLFLRDSDIDLNSLKNEQSVLFFTRSEELAERLVKYEGVDINKPDLNGECVILDAVRHKSVAFVECLLKNGADINSGEREGRTTPLIEAVRRKNMQMILLLIRYGANLNYVSPDGKTAVLESDDPFAVQHLLKSGLNVEAVAIALGVPPPMLFLRIVSYNIPEYYFRYFIYDGIDLKVNERNAEGKTFVMKVVEMRKVSLLIWAIRAKANVNMTYQGTEETALTKLCQDTDNFVDKRSDIQWRYKYLYDGDFDELHHDITLVKWEKDYRLTRNVHRYKTYGLIEILTAAGGVTNYSSNLNLALTDLIQKSTYPAIKAVLTNGAAPAVYTNFQIDIKIGGRHRSPLKYVTPLWTAFAFYDQQIVDTLIGCWFFTRFDLWVVPFCPALLIIMDVIFCQHYGVCRHKPSLLFKRVFSKPLTLQQICFVTVSDLIGPCQNREQKVRASELPMILQDRLMFREAKTVINQKFKKRKGCETNDNLYQYHWVCSDRQ